MKKLILCFVLIGGFAYAGFKLPPSAYTSLEITEAETKAKTSGKPITFLISNKDSTCPLCDAASETIIKELKTKTVLVYARQQEDIPEKARTLLKGEDTGRFIPYAVVMDSGYEKVLGVVQYETIKKDGQKAFRDVESAIRDMKKPAGGSTGSSLDAFKAQQPQP